MKARCAKLTEAVRLEACRAYADACETKQARASRRLDHSWERLNRNLQWPGTPLLARADAIRLAKQVVPTYNGPVGLMLGRLLAREPVCARLAREGSPAVYVHGPRAALERIAQRARAAGVDEVGITDRLRLWWD